MGSYPQIADKRGTHDLYGPVSRMMCAGYDRAAVMFLTCVKVPHLPLSAPACTSLLHAVWWSGIKTHCQNP